MFTEMHTFLMKRATHVGCVKPGVPDQIWKVHTISNSIQLLKINI